MAKPLTRPSVFMILSYMAEIPLSGVYLESLANSELFKIADELGLDVPDNPDRDFVLRELLETVSQEGSAPAFPHPDEPEPESANPAVMESVPIPKQYNIAFIEVMIRDPLWAFVFWEIKGTDVELFEKAPGFGGYYLKVSPLENSGAPARGGEGKPNENDGVFTVPVRPDDTARYLGLAPVVDEGNPLADECQYKVEFCAGVGDTETVLAVSNPIRLPGQPVISFGPEKGEAAGLCENRLVRLSGYGDFNLTRRNERPHRIKKERPGL